MKLQRNRLWFGRRGLTTVEYAMILGAFVVAAVSIWVQLGGGVQGSLTDCDDAFDSAVYAGDGSGHGHGRGGGHGGGRGSGRGNGPGSGRGWGPGGNRAAG